MRCFKALRRADLTFWKGSSCKSSPISSHRSHAQLESLTLLLTFLQTKMEITLLESRYKSGLEPDLNAFHDLKVPLALDIIESHQQIISEPRLQRWQWYWKHSHQWHSTIYVLEEVARRPEASFAGRVWEAINSVLTSPNILDKHGMNIETRTKLLDSHEHALQAREQLMRARTNLHSRPCQI